MKYKKTLLNSLTITDKILYLAMTDRLQESFNENWKCENPSLFEPRMLHEQRFAAPAQLQLKETVPRLIVLNAMNTCLPTTKEIIVWGLLRADHFHQYKPLAHTCIIVTHPNTHTHTRAYTQTYTLDTHMGAAAGATFEVPAAALGVYREALHYKCKSVDCTEKLFSYTIRDLRI